MSVFLTHHFSNFHFEKDIKLIAWKSEKNESDTLRGITQICNSVRQFLPQCNRAWLWFKSWGSMYGTRSLWFQAKNNACVNICNTAPHCAFSSNLFHGHLAHIYINQLSDPENKKCSTWNFFGKNHPQILRLLSRRGPRSPELGLSQHNMGPNMTFFHFSNFCRKKFPSLSERLKHIFIQLWWL